MWRFLKRAFKMACIVLVVGIPLIAGFVWYQDDVALWIREYKKDSLNEAMRLHVRELPSVDAIDVLRLVEDPVKQGQKPFCKSYYGTALYVTRKERLTGQDAESLAALWRSQLIGYNGVGCHDPHHAILFFHNGKQISRAVICFHCMNAEIPCTVFGGDLVGFDTQSPAYAALKSKLKGLVGAAE